MGARRAGLGHQRPFLQLLWKACTGATHPRFPAPHRPQDGAPELAHAPALSRACRGTPQGSSDFIIRVKFGEGIAGTVAQTGVCGGGRS